MFQKNIKIGCLITIFGMVLFSCSYAQTYDLFELLEVGKQNYPLLKSKLADVQSFNRRISSVKNAYIPDVVVGHQYTYATSNNVEGAFFPYEGTTISPSGGVRSENIYQPTFGSFTTAMLDWRIINFGKVSANIDVAKAQKDNSQADYENELFQYQVRLADTYLLLLISRQLREVQEYNLQRAENFRNTVMALVSAGLRAGVDSSLANAEYARAKLALLESQKNEKAYMYRLTELLGEIKDTISIDSMSFFNELPRSVTFNPSSIVNSPILKFHQSTISLANARSIAIKRSYFPSISLLGAGWARGSGIYNEDSSYRTDLVSGVRYQVYNYLVGVAFRWNVSSYFRIRNEFKSQLYQVDKFRFLYENQLLQQSREVQEADVQFEVSLQQAQQAHVQLAAAQSAFAQAQSRYESGLTDIPTYSQSFVTVNRAEADTYIAYSNAWRALLMKAAAAGDLSIFLNQIKR
ncbi:MAG TPA: TolC family protein [Cytophagaceae bacterium]